MTTPHTPGPPADEEDLLAALRRTLAESDPPPAELQEMGRAVLGLRRVDEQLAELVADSLEQGALTRAAPSQGRLLSFTTGDRVVDLQVETGPDGVVLTGELDAQVSGSVTVDRAGGGAGVTTALERGRFVARLTAGGPVRVRLQPEGGPVVALPWIST